MKRVVVVVILAVVACTTLSCTREARTETQVAYRDGLEFKFTGDGALRGFAVYSPSYPAEAQQPDDRNLALWVIEPTNSAPRLSKLGAIRYAVVPAGFVQKVPAAGEPAKLEAGQKYFFHVETLDAPGQSGYFEITGTSASIVAGEPVCFGTGPHGWVRKPCENNQKAQ